jgi:hypothetical protein
MYEPQLPHLSHVLPFWKSKRNLDLMGVDVTNQWTHGNYKVLRFNKNKQDYLKACQMPKYTFLKC